METNNKYPHTFALFLFVIWICISFVFSYSARQNAKEYTDATYKITTYNLWDHEKDITTLKESIWELSDNYRNTEAKIKESNSKLYEKEIKKAEKIIEDWWFNPSQCRFNDVVDTYYINQIIFHCSFSDIDNWYITVNIKSNTIVKSKNK